MLLTLTPTGTLLCEVFVVVFLLQISGFFLLQTTPVTAAIMNYFASNNKSFVTDRLFTVVFHPQIRSNSYLYQVKC